MAASTAVALVGGVGIWTAVQLNTTPPEAVDCSTLEAESFNEAAPLAQACGADVEVLAERTPWQTSYATSDKTSRLEVSALPSRVQVNGKWTAPDDSLVEDEKAGTIKVAAPVFPMQLNAGGTAGRGKPLASITSDGHRLDVWFPLDLPEPELGDSRATYQLATGIRLVVSVNGDTTGFLPVVELANPAAAKRFAAMLDAAPHSEGRVAGSMALEFATSMSDGLRLSMDDTNNVYVVDERGESQFVAPSPMMWDSSGFEILQTATNTQDASTDRTQAPAGGDQIVSMPVTLDDDVIVVSPDAAMLQSKTTEWPVYIDPGFSGQGATKRVLVRTSANSGYNSTIVGWTDAGTGYPGQGTGYCSSTSYGCGAVFYQRLAWRFTDMNVLKDLTSAEISKATFTVYGQHSFNCTNQTTTLWRTSDIGGYGSEPNYNNLLLLAPYGTVTTFHSNSCGNKSDKEFDALSAARWAADNDTSTLNLALIVGQGSMTPWKRYINNARFAVDYNRAPDVPSIPLMTAPSLPTCTPTTATSTPAIATKTPTISAIASDLDRTAVQAKFQVARTTDLSTAIWNSGYTTAMASSSRHSVTVPASAALVDGGVYAWRARAFDGTLASVAWSDWCKFAVDLTAPLTPTVTADTSSSLTVAFLENVETAGLQKLGKFTLGPNGATDVVSYSYGFNQPTAPNPISATGGIASLPYTPTTTGTVTLTVKAQDAAGNLSGAKTYIFKVATPTEDAVWVLDEGTGTSAAGSPGVPLTASGATWTDGPHELFGSRAGDHALRFDGVNDAATAAPVVDTTKSFVVSGFVWLDKTKLGTGSFTALSQDGTQQSGFQLGYTGTCAGMTGGCWSFSMPDTLTGPGVATAKSSVPVTGDEWTYLLAEHNVADGKIRLWVCEIGTPDDPTVGDPVKTEATRSATPWLASGAFAVGRGQSGTANTAWWPGAVDNVRVFSGNVVAESKIRRLCQGAEATDFSVGALGIDPTDQAAK